MRLWQQCHLNHAGQTAACVTSSSIQILSKVPGHLRHCQLAKCSCYRKSCRAILVHTSCHAVKPLMPACCSCTVVHYMPAKQSLTSICCISKAAAYGKADRKNLWQLHGLVSRPCAPECMCRYCLDLLVISTSFPGSGRHFAHLH